jgi:hypothetical protein
MHFVLHLRPSRGPFIGSTVAGHELGPPLWEANALTLCHSESRSLSFYIPEDERTKLVWKSVTLTIDTASHPKSS